MCSTVHVYQVSKRGAIFFVERYTSHCTSVKWQSRGLVNALGLISELLHANSGKSEIFKIYSYQWTQVERLAAVVVEIATYLSPLCEPFVV